MIFDNPFAPDEEGPFAPVDDSLQFGRRARVARLPLTRSAGQTYLGSPVAEQRALAAGPTPERPPLGAAPQDQAAAERQRLAGQYHALGEPPQPGKFHWYDYVLGALVPRVENMLATRRGQKLQDYLTQRSKILGDISTERTLGMLGGPEAAQEWTPIPGTNMEVNRKNGETRSLAGVAAPPPKEPKPAKEPGNPFALWHEQNPGAPVSDWYALLAGNRPPKDPQEARLKQLQIENEQLGIQLKKKSLAKPDVASAKGHGKLDSFLRLGELLGHGSGGYQDWNDIQGADLDRLNSLIKGAGGKGFAGGTKKITGQQLQQMYSDIGAQLGQVKMRAPNGQVSTIPAGQVGHYLSLGAEIVQ